MKGMTGGAMAIGSASSSDPVGAAWLSGGLSIKLEKVSLFFWNGGFNVFAEI